MTLGMEKGEQLRLEGPGLKTLRIACRGGCLWVTQSGDSRDHLLHHGEVMTLQGRGLVVLTALAPTQTDIFSGRRVSCWSRRNRLRLCPG